MRASRALPGSLSPLLSPLLDERALRRVEPSAITKVSALGVEEQRVNVLIDIDSPRAQWPTLGDGFRVGVRLVVLQTDKARQLPVPAPSRCSRKSARLRLMHRPRARQRCASSRQPERRSRRWCVSPTGPREVLSHAAAKLRRRTSGLPRLQPLTTPSRPAAVQGQPSPGTASHPQTKRPASPRLTSSCGPAATGGLESCQSRTNRLISTMIGQICTVA
jgi:hypothetical protein